MKLSSPEQLLHAKLRNIYSGQRRRSKEYGVTLAYSLDELRQLVGNAGLLGRCYYCQDLLTIATLTLDHIKPLSIGGEHAIHNLQKICKDCNLVKSNLDNPMMLQLMVLMQQWPQKVVHDFRARLKLGGARYRGGKPRGRKAWGWRRKKR